MKTFVNQFLRGFFSPVRGFALILSAPKRLLLSVLPFFIGFGLLFSGILWASTHLGGMVNGFLAHFIESSGAWFAVLSPILGFLTWAGFLTLGFLFVYIAVSILAGPFLSLLAENVLQTEGPLSKGSSSMALMVRMFVLSLCKALFFVFIAGISFVLWFFPPLNLVGSFMVLLTIAFDCMDFAFEVECYSLRDRASFFIKHLPLFSGIAVAILATTVLPGVFFLALPAFVVGATKLYIEIQLER